MALDFIHTPALIVQHCAVFGRLETPVRAYCIGEPERYAQHPVSVALFFIRPRKRTSASYTLVPDNLRYATVEVDGKVIYDTRKDVPCDMNKVGKRPTSSGEPKRHPRELSPVWTT